MSVSMRLGGPSAIGALLVLCAVALSGGARAGDDGPARGDDPDDPLEIDLWPDGVVPYMFDDGTFGPVAVHSDDQTTIENQMVRWEKALTITDPSTGQSRQYIDFRPCGKDCRGSYLLIRYNTLNPDGSERECNNMSDPVGMKVKPNGKGGITQLHLRRGRCPGGPVAATRRTNQDPNTILHELGHALGLWHEFNRGDADAYLVEQVQNVDCDGDGVTEADDVDGALFIDCFNTRSRQLMPVLGNYDYDSIMAYSGHQDLWTNAFSRQSAQARTDAAKLNPLGTDYSISAAVKSRLLQYYAHEHRQNWGFFEPLSAIPPPVAGNNDTDVRLRRNPYLAPGVAPVGTPAIAFQRTGDYDIFVRGSNNRLYWKGVRNNITPATWTSLGCCFGSDPAAISVSDGQVDLFAVGADSGKLIRKRYRNGEWEKAIYVPGGSPGTGIKQAAEDGGYLGPAVASRGPDSLDVFVVRTDGRLALVTLDNGQWTEWTSLGRDYNVTARPAAVALSPTRVQLAVNESDVNLYEPQLIFPLESSSFRLGRLKGSTARSSPPAVAKRDDADHPYRVLITNSDGRIAHRFANGSWRDIGGLAKSGTGPSAFATGPFGAYVVMNGVDLVGCDASCDEPGALNAKGKPTVPGNFIEPGGIWLRYLR